MKLLAALLITIFSFAGQMSAPAAAHPCLGPVHRLGCSQAAYDPFVRHGRHRLHWHDAPASVALPPPEPAIPYPEYYPPMPASLFDLPPDRDFLNHLR
ncbi:MAG TPA: hypothetical protein VGG12_04595 [Methylovirgula sp.]